MEELSTLRTFYTLGNFKAALESAPSTSSSSSSDFELITLIWKSILRATFEGDVSKCAQFWGQCGCTSELLKKALMIWSKVVKNNPNFSGSPSNSNSSDLSAAQEIAVKAHESADIDPQERDQVILTCAETALLLNSSESAFDILKLGKASNLDCQVMFVEILLRLGQVGMAQERLEKMKNIPEWKDDVRFLLIEAQLGLSNSETFNDSVSDSNNELPSFTAKDSLYSYQELIQLHGQTPRLLVNLAAAYVLLGKFQDAQNVLLQIDQENQKDPIINYNFLALSALLNSQNFTSSLK